MWLSKKTKHDIKSSNAFFAGHHFVELPLRWIPWWADDGQQAHLSCSSSAPAAGHDEPATGDTVYPLRSPHTAPQLHQGKQSPPANCLESNLIKSVFFALQCCSRGCFCLPLLQAPSLHHHLPAAASPGLGDHLGSPLPCPCICWLVKTPGTNVTRWPHGQNSIRAKPPTRDARDQGPSIDSWSWPRERWSPQERPHPLKLKQEATSAALTGGRSRRAPAFLPLNTPYCPQPRKLFSPFLFALKQEDLEKIQRQIFQKLTHLRQLRMETWDFWTSSTSFCMHWS